MIIPRKSTEDEKKPKTLKYLESTPAAFKEIADAILILDTGEELPAHRCTDLTTCLNITYS